MAGCQSRQMVEHYQSLGEQRNETYLICTFVNSISSRTFLVSYCKSMITFTCWKGFYLPHTDTDVCVVDANNCLSTGLEHLFES